MFNNTSISDLLSAVSPDRRADIARFLKISEVRTGSAPKAETRLLESLSLTYHDARPVN